MAERVTLNRKLPVVEGDWDAGAAKGRTFEANTNADGEFDAAGAADFFLVGDPDTGEKGDLHLPVGDIREGKSVIVSNALKAARSRLGQAGTLPDVAADVKERANDLAGSLLEELRSRKDALACVHDWRTGVMLPIPSEIAAMFPPREGHTPHITLVHVEWASPEETTQIMQIVAEEVGALFGEQVELGELAYFERFEDRVAFVTPLVSGKVRAARDRIAARIADLEIEVSRLGEEWNPHATLDVVDQGLSFVGTVPSGSWVIDDVQVWHGGEHQSVTSGDRADGRHGELKRILDDFGPSEDWFIHNTLAHPLMELLEKHGFLDAASDLHDLTLPDDAGGLNDPAAFAAWLSEALARADAELDEDTVKRWLVEHISHARKMLRPRMLKLRAVTEEFPYLSPPDVKTVYRGLHNVPASRAGKLTGMSDPVRDKSWTTELSVAAKFASTEWCEDDPKEGCVGVVLVADADAGQLLLNHEALASVPGVFDQWNERWGETLESAIRDEREVLALGPLNVRTVKIVDMKRMVEAGDGEARLIQDAASRRHSPGVITDPKTMIEVFRADAVEIEPAEPHPDGFVEYTVFYSRAGNVQVYDGLREWRPRSEVFAEAAMNSARGQPWELRHSTDLLTPSTVLGQARGCMRSFDRHPDGNHTFGRAKAWDQGLMDAIAGPAREVSLAYRALVDRRHGTSDDGDPFDQIARGLIINSLASEPKGKGGPSVRVHTDGVSRADVVTRADALLEIARGAPVGPVYFDPKCWVRYDGGVVAEKKDQTPMNPLTILVQKLLETRGSGAEVAAQLGIEPADFEALIADPEKIDDEMLGKLVALFAAEETGDAGGLDPDKAKMLEQIAAMLADGKMDRSTRDGKVRALFDQMMGGEGEPPPEDDPKREDGEDVEIEIDGEKVSVPTAVAAEIKKLREQASSAGTRADSAEAKVKDADLIPRADADKMALDFGQIMWLAKASFGQEFAPEPRADAKGAEIPITRGDWERAALTGAFGDEDGAKVYDHLDAAAPSDRAFGMGLRLEDAKKVIEERDAGHKSGEVRESIGRLRDRAAQDHAQGEDEDVLADAMSKQQTVAGATRRAPAPT